MKQFLSVLVFFVASIALADSRPQYLSQYTTIKVEDCMTVDDSELYPEPEIDFYQGLCPSFGGYVVEISGGDIRYNLKLYYGKNQIKTPRPGAFHDMPADKIEWRFDRKKKLANGNFEPMALIYRINQTDYDAQGNIINKDRLIVLRLNKEKSCLIGDLMGLSNMNVKARKIADNPAARCIREKY